MPERRTFTVTEAAQIIGISRTSAYEAVHRGDLPHFRVGRRILVGRADLDRLLRDDAIGFPRPPSNGE